MEVKPILFSAPMVRALLDGRKTQARRLIKPRGMRPSLFSGQWADSYVLDPGNKEWRDQDVPYQPGDLLYVREAWASLASKPTTAALVYRADTEDGERVRVDAPWRPSIHMPRWASRLTLEVTEVRVQRLQEISEEDAQAEGVHRFDWEYDNGECCQTDRDAFAELWDSLHGAGAWERNDWVAAITFTVHKANVDELLRQRSA